MPDYVADFLTFPLFRDLHQSDPERLETVYRHLEYVHHPVGYKLFRDGEPGDALYFATHGEVRFSVADSMGEPKELERIGAGRIFGEVAFFDKAQLRTADAEVTQDFMGFKLTQAKKAAFFATCPEAAELLLEEMAGRLARSSHQMRGMFSSLEDAVASTQTPFQRGVDTVASLCGSLWFLPLNLLLVGLLYHQGKLNEFRFDKDDIGLVLGFVATAVTVVVLNSQNRDARAMKARDRAIDQRTEYLKVAIEEIRSKLSH